MTDHGLREDKRECQFFDTNRTVLTVRVFDEPDSGGPHAEVEAQPERAGPGNAPINRLEGVGIQFAPGYGPTKPLRVPRTPSERGQARSVPARPVLSAAVVRPAVQIAAAQTNTVSRSTDEHRQHGHDDIDARHIGEVEIVDPALRIHKRDDCQQDVHQQQLPKELAGAVLLVGCSGTSNTDSADRDAENSFAPSVNAADTAPIATNKVETAAARTKRLREKAKTDPEGANAEAIDNMSRNELVATAINSAGFLCARVTSLEPAGGGELLVDCIESRSGTGQVSYRIDANSGTVEQR